MPTIDELKLDGEEPQEAERVPDIAPEALDALRLDPLSLAEADAEPPPGNMMNIPPVLPSPLDVADDDDQDEDDESLVERMLGLGEMFPEPIRNVTSGVFNFSWNSAKWLYSAGRVGAWVLAASAVILALPVMFETERAQMEEQQLQQQRQILLGPNAAVSGGGAHSGLVPGSMPQLGPPPAR